MCDTAVVVRDGCVLFAKNSDRDPNEAQLLEWRPAARHAPGSRLRCTWIEVEQAAETHAVLLSRPFWMWGAEMGANEHGLVIGNEAVFTRPGPARSGLTGMDLLRLALERARTAREAVEQITGLLERYPQGGRCGHEDPGFRYHSSFLIADPSGATVLETAGSHWAVEGVAGARSLSNGLSIEGFARRHEDRLRTRVARASRRRARSEAVARSAREPIDMMALLRDHGAGRDVPVYALLSGALGAPCVHAGGLLASSQTTASWVAELRPEGARHWVTGTAAPCTGLFKPVRVEQPLALGPAPGDRADGESLWWRHERLHRVVSRAPEFLLPLYAGERDALEQAWQASPPDPVAAFAEGDRRLAEWRRRVSGAAAQDRRGPWLRHYWGKRDRRAGLGEARSPALP